MGLNEIIKIGDRLKELRKNQNLTQSQLAEKIGIPRTTYANYENNSREPSKEILEKIADILNVSINTLIYGDYTNEPGITIALHNTNGIDDELPDEAKKEIENFIEYVRQKYKK